MSTELRKLAQRVPPAFVEKVNKGFGEIDFVGHSHVIQWLLYHLGRPFGWRIISVGENPDPKEPMYVVGELTLEVDGHTVVVAGAGSDRDIKKAESDALKRAAMKVGVALELWADGSYWLPAQWAKDDTTA